MKAHLLKAHVGWAPGAGAQRCNHAVDRSDLSHLRQVVEHLKDTNLSSWFDHCSGELRSMTPVSIDEFLKRLSKEERVKQAAELLTTRARGCKSYLPNTAAASGPVSCALLHPADV